MAPAAGVRLELIGGFRLSVGGVPVLATGTVQRLLAYLALNGPTARPVAAGTLWPDVPDRSALASLRTAIWQCNRTVDGVVLADGGRIELAGPVAADVAELAAAPTVAGAGRAVLRGELLPGWYDDWVLFERDRLRCLRLHAMERAAVRLAAEGRLADAYELAVAAVREEPLRESARRALISVHLTEHNVVEAVREFRRFRDLVVAQLGVEPSTELAELVFGHRRSPPTGGRRPALHRRVQPAGARPAPIG